MLNIGSPENNFELVFVYTTDSDTIPEGRIEKADFLRSNLTAASYRV